MPSSKACVNRAFRGNAFAESPAGRIGRLDGSDIESPISVRTGCTARGLTAFVVIDVSTFSGATAGATEYSKAIQGKSRIIR